MQSDIGNCLTEASKQRMEELEDAMVQQWRENFNTTADGYGLKRYGFKRGYQAGMQDPDCNSKKYDQAMKDWSADAIKKTEVIVKLEAENKKLREVIGNVDMIFESLDSPDFMKRYEGRSIELAIHGHHMTWIKVKKALSSGVE